MTAPYPPNELERLLDLSSYGLDYAELEDHFKDLTELAAKIAETEFSLINIIDAYTQWSVAATGIETGQVSREQTICQFTIVDDKPFEVRNILEDTQFKDQGFAIDQKELKYYWGIPLRTEEGNNLGALCVLDTEPKRLDETKVAMLQIIANEVVKRLGMMRTLHHMEEEMSKAKEASKKVAHDIRGPLGGILGLSQLIKDKGENGNLPETLQAVEYIFNSSQALLDLTDQILIEALSPSKAFRELSEDEYTLSVFQKKLQSLYGVQASQKEVNLEVRVEGAHSDIPFAKGKLLQIAGNLLSNAIKFTPKGKDVQVTLSLELNDMSKKITLQVKDNGIGMSPDKIVEILNGQVESTKGTEGERGFGFGLPVVRKLVADLGGKMTIDSVEHEFTVFSVWLPC
ncbi:MAG: GAF domain-containing sensor histidine kinase [Lunatimonas sp.]|uniref:sensor histidine kinase n=1 Tax=Lunatimonas sp. TaxID=2060141 RepID=UPI00263AC7E2|nr:GAF domain-containing sensor histidine kinase [Lunatimonas sp.]MCC5937651.1 GAF domain-containing sensor histidine kinase [Lunatimonas sp.]